jgi:hydrogenase expression/formation protein HypC
VTSGGIVNIPGNAIVAPERSRSAGHQAGSSIGRQRTTHGTCCRPRRGCHAFPWVEAELMCLGIPGRIVEPSADRPDLARGDVEGTIREINMALLEDDPPQPGDWILIHLGFALERMTEAEAQETLATMTLLGELADETILPSRPEAALP